MKKTLIVAVVAVAASAFAAPPVAPPQKGPHAEQRAEREKKMRMMAVVGIAEALDLPEVEALKLSDKLKAFDDRRRPLHESMGEAMRTLRQASEGDTGALAQVDATIQKVLDTRVQLAALDKEEFNMLSAGQPPQKKARLAVFMAHLRQEMRMMGGGRGGDKHERDE